MAGTAGIQTPVCVYFTQVGAGAANNDYTLTRGATLLQAWSIARATQVGGTLQIFRQALGAGGFTAVTDAMNAAADQLAQGCGTIDDAQYTFAATDVIRFTTVGAATLVDAVAFFVPPVADSTTV